MKPPIHKHVYKQEEGYKVCLVCKLKFREWPSPNFEELEDIFRETE